MNSEWQNGRNLSEMARLDVEQHIAAIGRQLPEEVTHRAVELLACVYVCGTRHGVAPRDWAAVASLPGDAVEVAVLTARRRGDR